MSETPHHTTPARWSTAALRGGPHDGQLVNLPVDQMHATFNDGPTPHHYQRFREGADLHHDSKLAAMFGGRARHE